MGLLVLVAALPAAAQPVLPHAHPAKGPDVIYVPTPYEVVDAMLSLAQVKPGEVARGSSAMPSPWATGPRSRNSM